MLIWGVHVHVGMPVKERVMPVLSALLTTYPHLQALSASSPVWAGVDTGYASNRALMFQQLPTAGLPFQFGTWEEFEHFFGDQITTGVIEGMADVRWDIRPAPHLGTLEHRVCDGVSTVAEIGALAALVHCLVVDLDTRLAAGEALPTLPVWHVQENKWRAARYGLDAIVITDADSSERLVTDDLADLLEHLAPTADRLGCAERARRGRRASRPAGRRTNASAPSPSSTTATWSPWSTRSWPSSRQACRRVSAGEQAARGLPGQGAQRVEPLGLAAGRRSPEAQRADQPLVAVDERHRHAPDVGGVLAAAEREAARPHQVELLVERVDGRDGRVGQAGRARCRPG